MFVHCQAKSSAHSCSSDSLDSRNSRIDPNQSQHSVDDFCLFSSFPPFFRFPPNKIRTESHLVTALAVPVEGIILLVLAFDTGPVVRRSQFSVLLVVALPAGITAARAAGRPRVRGADVTAACVILLDLAHHQMVQDEILK